MSAPPNGDEPSAPSVSRLTGGVIGGGVTTTSAPLPRAATTPVRSRRQPDYRLRGLDLDAHARAELPGRPPRRRDRTRRQRARLLVQWAVAIALTTTVALVLRTSVVDTFSVSSASMVPTLQVGTNILVVRPTILTGALKAGDIVVLSEPKGASCGTGGDAPRRLASRIIGLPGQTIWSAGERIYVDGRRLDEPGWYNPPFGEVGGTPIVRTMIPANSYFVLGDNRTDTCDSRVLGPVAKSLIVGRAVASVSRDGHLFLHSI